MNHFSRTTLFILLVILLTACGSSGGGGNTGLRNGETNGNSSGTVTGEPIGRGTSANSELRKTVPYTVVDGYSDLSLGTAYLTRRSESPSETASLLLPVTNIGTNTLCFVKAEGITYRQGTTALTDGSDLTFADGSVGKLIGDIFTNTCLGEGETGYLIDTPTDDPAWSAVDNLVIESVSGIVAESSYAGEVEPTSYATDELGRVASITGTNRGSITIYPSDFSKYILLDDAGAPLDWSFLDPPASGSLAPGSSGVWTPFLYTLVDYDGSASSLRVHFDYADSAATTSLSQQQAGSLDRSEMLNLGQGREKALEQLFLADQ